MVPDNGRSHKHVRVSYVASTGILMIQYQIQISTSIFPLIPQHHLSSSLHHPSLTPPPVTDNILPLALVTPPAACNCVPPAGDAEPATLKGVKPGNKWVLYVPSAQSPSPIPCHTSDGGGDTVPGHLSLTLSRTTTRPTSHATSPAYSLTYSP
ncbi:hypothetical protein Pcinc_040604 [Petrolisthes cinctipes]|uniref:Uncharacterized protein n=1 Tax=Petrolisthes cinctipes TaxID=88211 RepID=A0AAE1BPZ4_PETCI|nr:hypothetical protein Pcinc_040604 [Petrolisthes cinctipes]